MRGFALDSDVGSRLLVGDAPRGRTEYSSDKVAGRCGWCSRRLVRKYSGSMLGKLHGVQIEREYSIAMGGARTEALVVDERIVSAVGPELPSPC